MMAPKHILVYELIFVIMYQPISSHVGAWFKRKGALCADGWQVIPADYLDCPEVHSSLTPQNEAESFEPNPNNPRDLARSIRFPAASFYPHFSIRFEISMPSIRLFTYQSQRVFDEVWTLRFLRIRSR